jgi:hypothetical protein
LATLRTRAAFVRRTAVTVLIWVQRLYGRWRSSSIEVQGNLWVTDAEHDCWLVYADKLAWNITDLLRFTNWNLEIALYGNKFMRPCKLKWIIMKPLQSAWCLAIRQLCLQLWS